MLYLHKLLALILVLFTFSLATPVQGGAPQTVQRSQSKLSTRLEQLAASRTQTQATANSMSLPENGAGSLAREATGEVLVTIRVRDTTAVTEAALVAAGARITHIARRYNIVTALVMPQQLRQLANLASVIAVNETLRPIVRGSAAVPALLPRAAPPECPTGIVSEGDVQLRAAEARAEFGLSGAGINVGVLSDSFDQNSGATTVEQDIASGDLPGAGNPCGNTTPVQIVGDLATSGTDEGRAMAQIVHDLAPQANLLFATANGGMFAFADHIRALRQAGADIIVDDIFYLGEPFFQDGPINVAIREVVAQGAQYVSAAGNANVVDRAGRNVSSYEAAAYRPTACPALPELVASSRPRTCHNFAPTGATDSTSSFTLDAGASLTIEFQWAEPWFGVQTDFDLYVINNATNAILARSLDVNTGARGNQRPVEVFSYTAANPISVALVIGRFSGTATPRIKYVIQGSNSSLPGNGIAATEYHSENNQLDVFGPAVGDHAATVGALSIAATRYSDGIRTEPYSSTGPATHYFGPVLATGESDDPLVPQPAQPLAQPLVINKPDVTATDGVQNTFFNQYDSASQRYRFFGTSAAAPHAAGVAALVSERARAQSLTPSATLIERVLESTAAPMLSSSAANGAGRVDALEAVRSVKNPHLRLFVPIIVHVPHS